MNPIKPPLVSICIPTYLGANFLPSTIDSVLRQSYSNFEIWILDDNSPDDTHSIISRYHDIRIKYIKNPHTLGPKDNWNLCLAHAHGKYFKLLPHDDLLAENSLEQQVSVLESDSTNAIALVFGSRKVIDPNDRILMTRGLRRSLAGQINSQELIKLCIRSGTNLIGEPGNALFRSALIKKVGQYDASFPYVIDLDYWFRILQHGNAYYTATTTSSFRLSPNSWSVAIGNKQYSDFKGVVDKISSDETLKISGKDRFIGLFKARAYCMVRALFYFFLFHGRKTRIDLVSTSTIFR